MVCTIMGWPKALRRVWGTSPDTFPAANKHGDIIFAQVAAPTWPQRLWRVHLRPPNVGRNTGCR